MKPGYGTPLSRFCRCTSPSDEQLKRGLNAAWEKREVGWRYSPASFNSFRTKFGLSLKFACFFNTIYGAYEVVGCFCALYTKPPLYSNDHSQLSNRVKFAFCSKKHSQNEQGSTTVASITWRRCLNPELDLFFSLLFFFFPFFLPQYKRSNNTASNILEKMSESRLGLEQNDCCTFTPSPSFSFLLEISRRTGPQTTQGMVVLVGRCHAVSGLFFRKTYIYFY